jgi:ADP-ribosylglycohydrolase
MPIPHDYESRVYAGVLGKLIGVYLGRPIEGWTYERISREIGEIDHYLPGRDNAPLVVTDDDVTGTFTFLRALPDNGNPRDLTPQQIGEAWLNYTIERRTIFWWGGFGNSTEHTAYLRLKHGVQAPASGSIALNGKTVAEQIGAQIFIDGWAMVAPGDPELAADLARRAASVSHDGEAIYGAQIVAAMEAAAFVEPDLNKLIDIALGFIPKDSTIARLIHDVREWHAAEPDWRKARDLIAANYGYDKYGGACHMVPNHALIIHALLYGNDDFGRSLMIVNTSGWDTDCNSGNVGCLLGIKNGLSALEGGYDWRGPVADRLYNSTAEGGRGISDAVTETYHIVNVGRALAGEAPLAPKNGARFHFSLPGSVQGFQSAVGSEAVEVRNDGGKLAVAYQAGVSRVWTPTFMPPEAIAMPGYQLFASPTLHSGQTITARVEAAASNTAPASVRLALDVYGWDDAPETLSGDAISLEPGQSGELTWTVPDTAARPIFGVGLAVESTSGGTVLLDSLGWSGTPTITLNRPEGTGELWRRAWVDGVDQFEGRWQEPYRIVKNEGTGLINQGSQEWTDYKASAPVTIRLATAGGLAVRVQGMRRYYALLLTEDGKAQLVKSRDCVTVLAESPFDVKRDRPYDLTLQAQGNTLTASIDGNQLFSVEDTDNPLAGGAVGLIVQDGCLSSDSVTVEPAA